MIRRERDTFTAARDRTLREGLALTPADRVSLAEQLWPDFARGRTPPLVTVCRLLNAESVRYVVVGEFALALHGAVRATKDVDILIEPTLANARHALEALGGLRFGIARELDPADVVAKPLTIIGDDARVDLLTLAWSVRYADAAPYARTTEIDGVRIPFADLDTLIRSKQTGRLQDQADVETLERLKQLQR